MAPYSPLIFSLIQYVYEAAAEVVDSYGISKLSWGHSDLFPVYGASIDPDDSVWKHVMAPSS